MNQEQLFISVVIPVYNGEKFLKQAIANIQNQNYHPLEIIVVDDGSTDRTAAIAAEWKEQIRYFYQSNSGPAAARNLGIKQAKGDVIAFLDVDDLWPDNKLALQTNCLRQQPLVDIVQGFTQLKHKVTNKNSEEVYLNYGAPYYLSSLTSALYRKSVFERVGLFNEKLIYAEDTDWFLRAWEHRIEQILLDEVTLFYHKHERNMTKGKNQVELGLVRVYHQHLQRCRHNNHNNNNHNNNQKTPANFLSLAEYIGRDSQVLVKNYNFTIIANDRWGEMMYKYLGLMCQTPFVGTRIYPPCYIKLLQNFRTYIEYSLEITNKSRYEEVNEEKKKRDFVIGILNGDVEINFMNSQNPLEVLQSWNKRVKRINWDNLFIVFNCHNYDWQENYIQIIDKFEKLNFDYKVCFDSHNHSKLKSAVWIPKKIAYTSKIWQEYGQYFDVIAWLNRKYGTNSKAYCIKSENV